MKRLILVVIIAVLIIQSSAVSYNVYETRQQGIFEVGPADEHAIETPLLKHGFIQNDGQWPEDNIKFYGLTNYGYIAFTPVEIIHFIRAAQEQTKLNLPANGSKINNWADDIMPFSVAYSIVKIRYQDSNPISLLGLEPQKANLDFIRGSDPTDWYQKISSYGKVEYNEIYEGIDLVFYYVDAQIKYEFIIDKTRGSL